MEHVSPVKVTGAYALYWSIIKIKMQLHGYKKSTTKYRLADHLRVKESDVSLELPFLFGRNSEVFLQKLARIYASWTHQLA